MTEINVEVRRSKADIFRGVLENTLRSPGSLAWYVGGALVVAFIAVAANAGRPAEITLIIGVIVLVLMLAVYALVLLFCILLAARTTWRSAGALEPITYTFLDEGLRVDAASGYGLTRWETWKTAFETKTLIVIRHQLNLIHILPKRGLGNDVLDDVRSALTTHIKGARLRRPPLGAAA